MKVTCYGATGSIPSGDHPDHGVDTTCYIVVAAKVFEEA